ncbi:MJ0042-type zinc finger domain-containing protein [uncultured Cohaesibacter sp.]|uniref:zinc-ribbon domain-containing protein n=1 Tax=uncultured Cohaesibacter sp. TaxID=1002546 RepID=UPI002AAB0157|nr:MJ0042-type zinc finger domain-containing protein [uncultured Cohaesibacter sp.]
MKITCPNCATSYQVPDDYIGAEGRSVRCSSCGETWHAEQTPEPKPEKAPDLKPAPKPAAKEPEPQPDAGKEQSQDDIDALFDSPSAGKEQSQDDIDALFDSPSGGEEQSQDDIDALFDSPSGGEEQSQDDIDALFDSPSGGEEQSQDDIDALFDSPSGGEEQSQDDIDALFDSPSGGEEQSQDDIDSLFDEPAGKAEKAQKAEASSAGEPEAGSDDATSDDGASKPFVVKGDGGDDFQPPVVDLLDAAAFEAQKKVARGGTEARARRRRRKAKNKKQKGGAGVNRSVKREWVLGGAALATTMILLGALFMAPQFWVKRIPDLASLYSMFGMNVNVVGVDIEMVDVRLEQKSGSPVLAIETELVNPGTEPVILPSVEFSVLGKERLELYSWTIGPDHVGLGPGERKLIETSIAAPAQARYLSMRVFNE